MNKEIVKEQAQDVYIDLNSNYKWGRGWTVSESDKFNEEITQIFTSIGYEIEEPYMSGACFNAVRDEEKLYLHPMELAGKVKRTSIPAIELAMKQATTASIREVRFLD